MIDFDALVTQPCMRAFGMPVTFRVEQTSPAISTLGDGVTLLLGSFERAQRELRDDARTGAMMIVTRPLLGMSYADMISAGLSVQALNNGRATVTVDGATWLIASAEGPDSGGNVRIALTVTDLAPAP